MEIKTGPYEILLRFNCEAGEAFGHLRGCHSIALDYAVDENGTITGRIEGGGAKPLPFDDLQKYLGEQFTALNSQIEKARADALAARAEAKEALASQNVAAHNLKGARDQLEKLTEKHAAEVQSHEKTAQKLAEASAQIDVMRAEA